ncbi:MAG: YdcF family protein, partial [Pseudomonadota bacterium]
LERGTGARLLISGVNREASRADVLAVSGAVKPVYDCCVDLGYTAADTIGNAGEIAEWARAKKYRTLIVVTSDYHMPRSILEIRAAMPEATLVEYPVVTGPVDVRRWWRKGGDARRLTLEYSKYLAILGRESFLALGPRDEPAGAPAAEGKTAS